MSVGVVMVHITDLCAGAAGGWCTCIAYRVIDPSIAFVVYLSGLPTLRRIARAPIEHHPDCVLPVRPESISLALYLHGITALHADRVPA